MEASIKRHLEDDEKILLELRPDPKTFIKAKIIWRLSLPIALWAFFRFVVGSETDPEMDNMWGIVVILIYLLVLYTLANVLYVKTRLIGEFYLLTDKKVIFVSHNVFGKHIKELAYAHVNLVARGEIFNKKSSIGNIAFWPKYQCDETRYICYHIENASEKIDLINRIMQEQEEIRKNRALGFENFKADPWVESILREGRKKKQGDISHLARVLRGEDSL